jgi:hypothetical protein
MFSLFPRTKEALGLRLAAVISSAEVVANHFTGSEGPWWPFGFLRPSPGERFSSVRVAALAVLQGLPAGLFLILVDGIARRGAGAHRLPVFLVAICAAIFAINRVTLAYFWNRRAERLAKLRERRERWIAGGSP